MTKLIDEQLKKIWLVSDTVLYPEAATFLRDLNDEEPKALPLPNSQLEKLFNLVKHATYDEVNQYIEKQIKHKMHKAFYEKLHKTLATIERKRLQEEFQLVIPQTTRQEENAVRKALILLLAREFIQHLIAENGMYEGKNKKRSEKRG